MKLNSKRRDKGVILSKSNLIILAFINICLNYEIFTDFKDIMDFNDIMDLKH